MYTLQKENVVKIVAAETKRDELLSKGFILLKDSKPKKGDGNASGSRSQ